MASVHTVIQWVTLPLWSWILEHEFSCMQAKCQHQYLRSVYHATMQVSFTTKYVHFRLELVIRL